MSKPPTPPFLQRPLHLQVLGTVRFTVAVANGLQVMRLAGRIGFGAEVGSRRATFGEVAGEDGLDERSEDNLGTTAAMSMFFP